MDVGNQEDLAYPLLGMAVRKPKGQRHLRAKAVPTSERGCWAAEVRRAGRKGLGCGGGGGGYGGAGGRVNAPGGGALTSGLALETRRTPRTWGSDSSVGGTARSRCLPVYLKFVQHFRASIRTPPAASVKPAFKETRPRLRLRPPTPPIGCGPL
ncbi:uncharacterized protein RHO17_014252 [Thomomys bottae]